MFACYLCPFSVADADQPDRRAYSGLFGFWLGRHQVLTIAHNYAPASTLSPFGYSFILFLTVWSYLIFDHLPDRWTIIGAVVIVISGLIIWFRELYHSRKR